MKKDWNHVRKCQKFEKSSCRPMFSQRNKTLWNIPLCKFFQKIFQCATWNEYNLRPHSSISKMDYESVRFFTTQGNMPLLKKSRNVVCSRLTKRASTLSGSRVVLFVIFPLHIHWRSSVLSLLLTVSNQYTLGWNQSPNLSRCNVILAWRYYTML